MKYGSDEWYLYHNKMNEEPIIPLIVLSCFLAFIKSGILWIIIVWYLYFKWASKNNEELNNDPEIIERRLIYIKLRNNGTIK